MCESTAYILRNGKEEVVLEDVDAMEREGDMIKIRNIFGEEKLVKARLKRLSLVDHKIILEPIQ